MRLAQRVQRLRDEEVADVLRRVGAVREALVATEKRQAEYFAAGTKSPDWLAASRKTQPVDTQVATWNLKELRRAVEPALAAIEAWVAQGESAFFPQVIAWDRGDDDAPPDALAELVRARQEAAERLEAMMPPMRSQLAFVPPVRAEAQALLQAVQAVQRVEDVEIVPSVLSGRRTTSTQATGRVAERYKTSDDVARSLRMARPPELVNVPKEEEPEPGFLGSLRRWLRR